MENRVNHIAIIMDGNGRWATRKGLPRKIGHYYGSKNITTIAKHARSVGVKVLTVYAFSTENWARPKEEIDYLMSLPAGYLKDSGFNNLKDGGIKIKFAGRKDRIPETASNAIKQIEAESSHNNDMLLQICFDYGGYDEIINAFKNIKISDSITEVYEHLYVKQPVDLLIRTGGEQRISNFLLWQIGYAEIYFTKTFWPAFNEKKFDLALKDYYSRQRRFGGLK